jgi:excisionase family DNA binding protein
MSTVTTAPLLLSFVEAGVLLGVSRDSIYKLVSAGQLPFCQMSPSGKSSMMKVSRADIDSFIAARTFTVAS